MQDMVFDWVVIDLVVPQDGWRDESYLLIPGIKFVEYVRSQFGDRVRIAVYSVAMTSERMKAVVEAGATIVRDKQSSSMLDLLAMIVEASSPPDLDLTDLGLLIGGEGDSSEKLRQIIDTLRELHLSLGHRLTLREIQALHLAKLASVRKIEEEKQRSLQTIAAILSGADDRTKKPEGYDVFLSYARADVAIVRTIAQRLVTYGITPWFDLWAIRPGDAWINTLQSTLPSIRAAFVFIGSHGVGPWQDVEVQVLLQGMLESSQRVIPVLLDGAMHPDKVPPFLRILTWLRLSSDLDVGPLVQALQVPRESIQNKPEMS